MLLQTSNAPRAAGTRIRGSSQGLDLVVERTIVVGAAGIRGAGGIRLVVVVVVIALAVTGGGGNGAAGGPCIFHAVQCSLEPAGLAR